MKTFFAIVLTVLTLLLGITYPFEPNMMLLLEFFVIGIPSFLLTFEPNNDPIKGDFAPQVLRRSLPKALLMLVNVVILMILRYSPSIGFINQLEYQTLVILVMTYTGC
jgi:cation-transporting ATPase E